VNPPVNAPAAPVGSGPVSVDSATMDRVSAAVRYVERAYRNTPPATAGGFGVDTPLMLGRVTMDVGPRSGRITGVGYGYLQYDDGSALLDDTDTGVITFRSFFDKTLAAGPDAFCLLGWSNGWYVASPGSCRMVGGTTPMPPPPAPLAPALDPFPEPVLAAFAASGARPSSTGGPFKLVVPVGP
jgi:hypothetical protein